MLEVLMQGIDGQCQTIFIEADGWEVLESGALSFYKYPLGFLSQTFIKVVAIAPGAWASVKPMEAEG